MRLFRKSKRESASLLEDSAENHEAESRGGAVTKAGRFLRLDSLSTKRLRVSADVEDDGAETELINEERRRNEN